MKEDSSKTCGMVIADAFGIIVGIVMGKRIPERLIKWFAALVFIIFGVLGIYGACPKDFWTPPVVIGSLLLLLLLFYGVVLMNKKKRVRG